MAAKETFLNPFDKGVTYPMFVKAMGRKSVKTYCKGHLTGDDLNWIITEIENFKNK